MAALRKLAAAATTSALLAPRARAEEAPADEAQAAELRAKTLALAAAQRERTDWEARRLHQLMRAVDEEHSRERAATLEKAATEDAKAFAEERARKAEQRAKSDEAAAVRERAEARADVRRLLTEYDDALAAVWRGKVQEAEGAAHSKARETLLAEIEAAANERDDAPRLQTVFERRPPKRPSPPRAPARRCRWQRESAKSPVVCRSDAVDATTARERRGNGVRVGSTSPRRHRRDACSMVACRAGPGTDPRT